MKLEEFREELRKMGLDNDQISKIVDLAIRGLGVKVQPCGLMLEAGNAHIEFLNPTGETADGSVPLRSYLWVANIDGIDPCQIRFVRIPELRYDDDGLFEIEVGLFPWDPPHYSVAEVMGKKAEEVKKEDEWEFNGSGWVRKAKE